MQLVSLDKQIKLLDSPGIVFTHAKSGPEAAESVLRNCVKVELVTDPIAPVDLILSRCDKNQLMVLYTIPYFNSTSEFLIHVARNKGRIRKGGVADIENAARCVIQDWNSGKIPYFSKVPETDVSTHVSSAIVDGWTAEFELKDVVEVEGKNVLNNVKSKSEQNKKFFGLESTENNDDVDMDQELSESEGSVVSDDGDEMFEDEEMDQDEEMEEIDDE